MSITAARSLWAITALCVVLTVVLLRDALADASERPWQIQPTHGVNRPVRADMGEVAMQVISTDPFRLDRRPAEMPFGSSPALAGEIARPASPAPTVSGIIGPPWKAVVEGIPGRHGSVLVAQGDTIGGYRIVAIESNLIVIQAQDTTWRLGVRKAW